VGCLDEKLADAKHGREEDSMVQHPLDVGEEGDGWAPKRPDVKKRNMFRKFTTNFTNVFQCMNCII
jgi:hypothetical protein